MSFHFDRFVLSFCLAITGVLFTNSALAAETSCKTVAACVFGNNTTNGPGVQGSSASGFGVAGISTSNHGVDGTSNSSFGVVGRTTMNSTSTSNARAGVLGTDSSTNKTLYNSGVAGISTYGDGVRGQSTSGHGVEGFASNGIGIFSQSGYYSIAAFTKGGVAISGDDYGSGVAMLAIGRGNGRVFVAANNTRDVASIDTLGNMILAGTLTQSGTPLLRTKNVRGEELTTFGLRSSTPALEDTGEANLVNGQATVALEDTFVSAIDSSQRYMVFLTPLGNSKGLYVTQISTRSFVVRENENGRSTLAFDYRIVAKPFDTKQMRLTPILPSADLSRAPRIVPTPEASIPNRATI